MNDSRDLPDDVVVPTRYAAHEPRRRFTRGRHLPRGVKWFGVQSFWGHLRHLAAVAIATEDVDSRSWMTPDEPRALLERVCSCLGGRLDASNVTESLGRDLWLDYLADTGDDAAVSHAVAQLTFARYAVPDPELAGETLLAPRGDILLFGGDTAYPVATAEEITNRVLVPFNRVLQERPKDRERVLLGVPGNHDWYDGLDGFARMFRRRLRPETHGRAPTSQKTTTLIDRYATYARQFVKGGQIEKPAALELLGYEPVQSASHFILPLSGGLVLFGVDRQLKRIDPRQHEFFTSYLNQHPAITPWVALPDPLFTFGERSESGFDMLGSLGLRLRQRAQFFLSGDIHHYRRERAGGSLLVTAGGGGAFLHPAAMRKGESVPEVEWPDLAQSRALLWQVPWKVAAGRSGILPHLLILLVLLPAFLASLRDEVPWGPFLTGGALSALLLGASLALMAGGARARPTTLALASCSALLMVATAMAPSALSSSLRAATESPVASWSALVGLVLLSVFASVFLFGTYLALLTRFGLESTQAFTALDHPGFKHFLRFRVRADGSAVDGYCIGLADPLCTSNQPVLVDQFTFRVREQR